MGTLHVHVYCVLNNASCRSYRQNFKMHDVHVLYKPARLLSNMLFDIELELFVLQ